MLDETCEDVGIERYDPTAPAPLVVGLEQEPEMALKISAHRRGCIPGSGVKDV
jgi:hypothetical protein